MADDHFSKLPEPEMLPRSVIVEYSWGTSRFEVICTACSIRAVPDSGEMVTWLHCKACPTEKLQSRSKLKMMTIAVPVQYITGIRPGPRFRIGTRTRTEDVGVFPPDHPAPDPHLTLAEIEHAIDSVRRAGTGTRDDLTDPCFLLHATDRQGKFPMFQAAGAIHVPVFSSKGAANRFIAGKGHTDKWKAVGKSAHAALEFLIQAHRKHGVTQVAIDPSPDDGDVTNRIVPLLDLVVSFEE